MISHLNVLAPEVAATFYSTVAALLGTVFALLFSFSLFTVQHAASNYAPVLLDDFKHDKRTKRLFVLFIVAVVLNLVLLAWPATNLLAVIGSLALAVYAIVKLGAYYRYTVDLINPLRLAERLADRARATLRKLPALSANEKGAAAQVLRDVFQDVEGLFDLVYRAVDKQELHTSRHGLAAIRDIADEYCRATKDVLRRDDPFLLSLNGVCERLFGLATVATKGECVGALTEIVAAYHGIATSTLQIALPASPGIEQHDLAYRVIGYLREISQRAFNAKLGDVGMAAATALGAVAMEMAKRGYTTSALTLCKFLLDVGVAAVDSGCWQAATYCNSSLCFVLASFLDTDQDISHVFPPVLQELKHLCIYALCKEKEQPASVIGPFVSRLSQTSPARLVDIAAARFAHAADDRQRGQRFGQLQDAIAELVRLSVEVGRALACVGLNVEVDSLRDSLEHIGGVCLEVRLEATDERAERTLDTQLGDVQMAYSRIWDAFPTGDSSLHHEFLQSAARLAIAASEKNMDTHARLGMRVLCGIAKQSAEQANKVSLWEPPRQALYAAAIGIHGLHCGKEALVTESFARLRDFLDAYGKTWPGEVHRLEQELRELRTEWNESRFNYSLDHWNTYLFPRITGEEIDSYTERLLEFLAGKPETQPQTPAQ